MGDEDMKKQTDVESEKGKQLNLNQKQSVKRFQIRVDDGSCGLITRPGVTDKTQNQTQNQTQTIAVNDQSKKDEKPEHELNPEQSVKLRPHPKGAEGVLVASRAATHHGDQNYNPSQNPNQHDARPLLQGQERPHADARRLGAGAAQGQAAAPQLGAGPVPAAGPPIDPDALCA